ncbi:MAG TPA: hypothetical protein VGS96_22900 [Thermoanaerobaculia bacterium]|nr:hypothetical protein [Thermoanaerobaculia bacterium]
MRRSALLVAVVAMTWSTSGFAATQRPLIVTAQDHSLVDSDDCATFYTQNTTSLPSQVTSEEQRRISLLGVELLHVRTANAGGVSVRGWEKPFARLTICKYAAALNESQAQRALQSVGVAVRPGEIAVHGPDLNETQAWWVHMILRVPKSANVDVAAANGGIAIRNMAGRITARATNGGISLASCTGVNRIETENGGISLDHIDRVDATTQNGPIALKLRDTLVPPLEARTDDEIVCKLKICTENWAAADRKRLRIGGSSPQIRLISSSAPILIEQVR